MLKSRDISRLRSDVAANCRVFIQRCAAEGLPVLVVETVRDLEYQASLYAQGRTKPGKIVTNQKTPSFHWNKVGLAFDICKNVKGHEYDDADFFRRCGAIGKEMGFSWGGDWKSLPDRPHFQWDDGGRYTAAMVRKGQLPRMMPLYKEVSKAMTKDEAKRILKAKAGLSDATITYLDSYRYGDDLIVKLAEAVQKS
nr:MAG TPA: L-Ala-D-Glu peptidase-like protein [Caudoviricetes sp.]